VLIRCQEDSKNTTEPEIQPFIIENLGVTFAPYDPETGHAGDFVFSDHWQKVFGEFGARVRDYKGDMKELPNMSYIVREKTPVLSICRGKVNSIYHQEESGDYEISVRSSADPSFEVFFDHVVDLRVKLNDTVQAGDTLAHPRLFYPGLGSFEVQINNTETKRSYCPFNFITGEKYEAIKYQVERLIEEWEVLKGDSTIYDEENWPMPGCRLESMLSY
jgi:hypothetical protein